MNKRRKIYNILGLAAVIGSLLTAIISFIMYLFRDNHVYFTYGILWLIISLINYLLWRTK